MILPKFEYFEPETIHEACSVIGDLKEKGSLLAGGTDLIVNMKKKIVGPGNLVSLGRIKELKEIETSNGVLRIGACVTADELMGSEVIGRSFSALWKGAANLGSPLIRNRATVGGNIISARPAADLLPAMIAYGGKVLLKKSAGERSLLLEDFITGPGQTVIETDEILTHIVIDIPPEGSGAGYAKLGVRKALEISLVNVAAYLELDSKDGSIRLARIVLGSVAPTPVRAPSAEKVLLGEKPSEELFEKTGEAASGDCSPIDDFRGSAEYRKDMVKVLTSRALNDACQEASVNHE